MSEFDEKAKQWDQNQMHFERTKAVAKEMLLRIPGTTEMKALEFGAGTGLLSFFVKESFARITLMDTSVEMLKIAESKIAAGDQRKIDTLFFDLEKSAYTAKKFNIIFTQMVLHHIRDVNTMLQKFYDLLLPGGYVAIADLYAEDGSFHDPGVEVHQGFDPEELTVQLKACGFMEIAVNQCFVIQKETNAGTIREFPVFLLTAKR